MAFSLRSATSYQDAHSYDVWGHDYASKIEAYRADPRTLEYMRSTFNHCGDPTSFDRNITDRQGGAVVRVVHQSSMRYPYRWTLELYALFIGELYRMRAEYLIADAARRAKYGEDWPAEPQPMPPIPRPIYFDHSEGVNRFVVEPWFNEMMTRPADSSPAAAGGAL